MGAFLLEGAGINGAAIADIAVILIFLLFGIVGIAKGFTRKLFKRCASRKCNPRKHGNQW